MSESEPPAWCLYPYAVFLVLMAAAAVWGSFKSKNTRLRTWHTLAEKTGLTIKPAGLFTSEAVVGEYRGRQLKLYAIKKGRTSIIRITASLTTRTNIYLFMSAGGLGSIISRHFDSHIIKVGDEKFDLLFVIKGHPESLIIRILDSTELRRKLSRLCWKGYVKIELVNKQLYLEPPVEYPGNNVEYFEQLFNLACDLAEAIEQQAN